MNLPFQGVYLLPPLPDMWQLPAQERIEQSNKMLPSRLPHRGWESKGQGASGGNKLICLPWPCSHAPHSWGGWEEPVKAASPGRGALRQTDALSVKRNFQKPSSRPAWGRANRAGTIPASLLPPRRQPQLLDFNFTFLLSPATVSFIWVHDFSWISSITLTCNRK